MNKTQRREKKAVARWYDAWVKDTRQRVDHHNGVPHGRVVWFGKNARTRRNLDVAKLSRRLTHRAVFWRAFFRLPLRKNTRARRAWVAAIRSRKR